jgi:8-oxo-dGTP pyrophosphatase MutT (NUDIX family)
MTNVAALVRDAPWFGGVHVCDRQRLLLTIGAENPEISGPPPPRAHVRWIGGKPLPGESFLHCAEREAEEELGSPVEVAHAAETIVDLRPDPLERLALSDRPAPLLVQRYDDGTVLVIYRARLLAEPHPADVERLAWVPLDAVEPLCDGLLPDEATLLGIEVLGAPLDPEASLFIGRLGAEYLLWRLGTDAGALS